MRSSRAVVRSLGALAGALLACAATPPREAAPQLPERASAYAHPEPDPACRGTVQESLAANGLERVVVKLARAPGGGVRVVEFLSPDLTPAAKVELTRAFGECVWAPRDPVAAEVWTDTVVGDVAAPSAPER